MTAMDHNSGNTIAGVIKFFAEGAVILVQQFIDEVIDFVAIQIRGILSLFEEESRWIFQFFHLIQKYILTKLFNNNKHHIISHISIEGFSPSITIS